MQHSDKAEISFTFEDDFVHGVKDREDDYSHEILSSKGFSPLYLDSSEVLSETSYKFSKASAITKIVHTSTIPLATTVGPFAGNEPNYVDHNCDQCMMGKKKTYPIKQNCPCQKLDNYENLKNVCASEFFSVLHHNLDKVDVVSASELCSEYAFCKDSENIFSRSYSAYLRKKVGVTGFDKISSYEELLALMKELYWFNAFKGRLPKVFKNIEILKKCLKQTLYTVNGCLIKIFFVDHEMDYKHIAKKTSKLFDVLMTQYTSISETNNLGLITEIDPSKNYFGDLKDFLNYVKETCNSESRDIREETFHYPFKTEALRDFFNDPLANLYERACRSNYHNSTDYTETYAWKFICMTLCQTRALGYLPRNIAEYKAQEYRKVLSRTPERISDDRKKVIYETVTKELNPHVTKFVLSTKEPKEQFEAIIENIDLEIKNSASFNFKVSDGGKVEEARYIINLGKEHKWVIPIRDLRTGEIKDYADFTKEEHSYSKLCFWFSTQLVLNNLVQLKLLSAGHYVPLPGYNQNELFYARILHIQEPGKQRNLIKGSGPYAWFLTPAGKICQKVLAFVPEHKVGIEGSSDAWKFLQRIHPEDELGNYFFDKEDKVKEGSEFFYSDWTESTDFITKQVGICSLEALMDYIDFPLWYGRIVKILIVLPQRVKEVHSVTWYTDDAKTEFQTQVFVWNGQINDGYMMGNPITKTILHLCHIVDHGLMKRFLKAKKWEFKKTFPRKESLDFASLRKFLSKDKDPD